MQTRRLLICLALLLLLLLGLLRTLDEDRGAPAPPLAPAGDLESHALSGPPPEGERAKVPGEPASSGDPGEAEELALSGSVTRESDGEPIVGARVLVYDRRPLYEGAPWLTEYCGDLRDLRTDLSPIAETRTAGLGTFRVAVPAPGTWAVVVRHPPLKPASGVMRTGEDQWFSLRESARMSFRVVDETDRPVAGAQAFVFASGPSSRVLSHAVSDAQGRFEVEGCPSYDELLIRADGYADRLLEDLCDWVDEPIVLRSPYHIAGVVLDPEGRPVEGASVVLTDYCDELRLTGADGRFSFDRVAPRNSDPWLDVRHPRLGSFEVQVSPGDEKVVARFGPRDRFAVAGRFEFSSPNRVTQLHFHAFARWPEPNLEVEHSSSDFRIGGAGEGTLTLRATAVRRVRTVCGQLDLRTAEGSLELEIARGLRVEDALLRLDPVIESYVPLKAVDETGKPIQSMGFVFGPDGEDREVGILTNRGGIALVRLLLPAGTAVELRTGGRIGALPIYDLGHSVSVVTTIESEVQPTIVTVRRSPEFVLEARDENDRSLPPGTVAKFLVQQAVWSNYADALPGDSRCGRAPLLPGEPFRLIVRATGRASVHRSFGPPGGKVRRILISLPPEGRLRGRLLTATGRPVAHAELRAEVLRGNGPAGYGLTKELRPDGRFEVGGLCSGRARLSILRDGAFAAEVFADVVTGRVADLGDVKLVGVTTLRGTVFGADLRGLGGVGVAVLLPVTSSTPFYALPLARTHTRSNGTYDLPVPWRPNHEVVFTKHGFEEVRLSFDPKQFENPLDVTLVRSR